MDENRVCLVDCCVEGDHSTAARLLSELTGSSEVDCSQPVTWAVDNKYYQATVSFEVRAGPDGGQEWEAIVSLCDLLQPLSVQNAYSVWEGLGAEATPPVNLLVGVVNGSGLVGSGEEVRSEMVQWCLGRGVELVTWETEASTTQTEKEEDDFPEAVGVARISEALQAHMWPEMTLKKSRPVSHSCECSYRGDSSQSNVSDNGVDKRTGDLSSDCRSSSTSPNVRADPSLQSCAGNASTNEQTDTNTSESSSAPSQARLDSLLADTDHMQLLERGLGDDTGEDFESLFARFAEMKTHAQSLPHEERKAYAEKVVMSFWQAIGGDEEEVCVDSSSDSESTK